ncbi:MAG TPA: hypothetical protein VK466_11485, partial [Terriglobales bacterium]|nr:hypothetical protein [Terriglobales bacterium]
MKTTRRNFVRTASLATISSAFAQLGPSAPLPIAFSTLGCPRWTFTKVLDFAVQNGFAAIELRGLEGNLDLPSHPVFATQHLQAAKHEITSR